MEEMYVYKNQKKLRWGYTTGTCGTAASMAAALMLLGQKRVGQVKVSTPKGLDLDLEIEEIRFTKEQAVCAVRKDSGDDPDVTNGIAIYSRVSFRVINRRQKAISGKMRLSGFILQQERAWVSLQSRDWPVK